MSETIQRTPEGLSLVDPFIDLESIAREFPRIVAAYARLPGSPDNAPVAAELLRKKQVLTETKQPQPEEEWILGVVGSAERAIVSRVYVTNEYTQAIGLCRQALSQVDFVVREASNRRLARMWFFERMSHYFYQIGNDEHTGANQGCIQAVIACIYSDLELGAKDTTISRGRHALSTAYGLTPGLQDGKNLIIDILIGNKNKLPRGWWDNQREQELKHVLAL